MNSDTYQRIKTIFLSALERRDGLDDYLHAACAGCPDIRRHVERLIAAHDSDGPLSTRGPASAAGPPRPLPETVGNYRILGLLGEGGMGTVYRAEQQLPRRQVALKVIRANVLSPESVRRFLSEIHALGSLRHPGVAVIHDAGMVDDNFPFFAMELVEGLSLLQHARTRRLDLAARAALLARIAEALQHAHDRGVIHSDLKPGNILVEPTGQPKVLDFGIARLRDAAPAHLPGPARPVAGTPLYMSPEQLAGGPIDHRSDLYALGVIAERLIAEDPDLARPRSRDDARLRVQLQRVIDRLLAPSPGQRPQSAGEVARLLDAALAARRTHRTRRLAVSSLAAALIVATGAILFAALRPPTPVPAEDFGGLGGRRAALFRELVPGEVPDVPWEPDGPEAREALRRLLDRDRAVIAQAAPDVDLFPYRNRVVRSLWALGDLTAAEAAARENLELALQQDLGGPRFIGAVHLASLLQAQGRLDEAVEVFERLEHELGSRPRRDAVMVARYLAARARIGAAAGRADARESMQQAVDMLSRLLEDAHPLLVQARDDLAAMPPADAPPP